MKGLATILAVVPDNSMRKKQNWPKRGHPNAQTICSIDITIEFSLNECH